VSKKKLRLVPKRQKKKKKKEKKQKKKSEPARKRPFNDSRWGTSDVGWALEDWYEQMIQ
jgi:hypothetical protein